MNGTVRARIESLRGLSIAELKQQYQELFGYTPAVCQRAYLRQRIAWRWQAGERGDISARARQRAAEIAFQRETGTDLKARPRDRRLPAAGTTLTRSYHGRAILVRVGPQDFEYEGRRYGSLSAIAFEVTGTRWNGFVFFGLASGQPEVAA